MKKTIARTILILLGISSILTIFVGFPYWTREGIYAAGTNILWYHIPIMIISATLIGLGLIYLIHKLIEWSNWDNKKSV